MAALAAYDKLEFNKKEKECLAKTAISLPLDLTEFFLTHEHIKRIDVVEKVLSALYKLTNYAPFGDKNTLAQLKRNCYARKRRAAAFSLCSSSSQRKPKWSVHDNHTLKNISVKIKNATETEQNEELRKSA